MKNKILPIVTAVIVIIAICIVIFIPKNSERKESKTEKNATFINYETENGYEIELVAVKDSSNNIDVAFNTCQVCNGSPKAYFVQKNGKLVCQNCGNVFSLNSVGKKHMVVIQ